MCIRDRLEVCHGKMSQEIKETNFLAVIADETNDIANTFQMAVVYRICCERLKDSGDFSHLRNMLPKL